MHRDLDDPVVVELLRPRRVALARRCWAGRPAAVATASLGHLTFDVQGHAGRRRQREHLDLLAVDADLEMLFAEEMRDVLVEAAANATLMTYSPSRGAMKSTRVPPRVPTGIPSRRTS